MERITSNDRRVTLRVIKNQRLLIFAAISQRQKKKGGRLRDRLG